MAAQQFLTAANLGAFAMVSLCKFGFSKSGWVFSEFGPRFQRCRRKGNCRIANNPGQAGVPRHNVFVNIDAND
jgi:hypothetical protein